MAKITFEKVWATVLLSYYIAILLVYAIRYRYGLLRTSEKYMAVFYIFRVFSGSSHLASDLISSDIAKGITIIAGFLSILQLLLATLNKLSQL